MHAAISHTTQGRAGIGRVNYWEMVTSTFSSVQPFVGEGCTSPSLSGPRVKVHMWQCASGYPTPVCHIVGGAVWKAIRHLWRPFLPAPRMVGWWCLVLVVVVLPRRSCVLSSKGEISSHFCHHRQSPNHGWLYLARSVLFVSCMQVIRTNGAPTSVRSRTQTHTAQEISTLTD